MIDNSKLIVKATVKTVTENTYILDCTGMTMDEVKSEMEVAYVENRSNWEYDDDSYEILDSSIITELMIIDREHDDDA